MNKHHRQELRVKQTPDRFLSIAGGPCMAQRAWELPDPSMSMPDFIAYSGAFAVEVHSGN